MPKVQKDEQMRGCRTAFADTKQNCLKLYTQGTSYGEKQTTISILIETSHEGAFNAQTDRSLNTLPTDGET